MLNDSSDVVSMDKAKVGKVEVTSDDGLSKENFSIFQGISIGSTKDELQEKFGIPTQTRESDFGYSTFEYAIDTYAKYQLKVEDDVITSIQIQNYLQQKESDEQQTKSQVDLPESVTAYKAPENLGNDWQSMNVEYGGVVYHLPVPVNALLENGWQIKDSTNKEVDAMRKTANIKFIKDNQVLTTEVVNYEETAQPLENVYVSSLKYSSLIPTKISLAIPGGIDENSSLDEIKAKLGTPDEEEESTRSLTYIWETADKGYIEIYWNKEENAINSITVSNAPDTIK
jgi:hypothetical protein